MTKSDLSNEESTVWIYQIRSSQSVSSIAINSRLLPEHAPPSLMHVDLTAAPTFSCLSQAEPILQVAANINIDILLAAMECGYPLQRGSSRLSVSPLSLFSFLNTRIPLRAFRQVSSNLRDALGVLESADRS